MSKPVLLVMMLTNDVESLLQKSRMWRAVVFVRAKTGTAEPGTNQGKLALP